MHPALGRIDHRPWPLPRAPWVWRQTWHDLLFAHWPVKAADLRPFVPRALAIEEFGGSSWVGLVPFRMSGVRLRGLPPVPGASAFPEMNLRLYVSLNGVSGVWFVSLDASSRTAVRVARRFAHLPYFLAAMSARQEGDRVIYASERRSRGRRVGFRGTYWPTGDVFEATPGSLEHFLTERYCLFARTHAGKIRRMDIHHRPWALQPADARLDVNMVAEPQGIRLPPIKPLLHFSRRLDVIGWRSRGTGARSRR